MSRKHECRNVSYEGLRATFWRLRDDGVEEWETVNFGTTADAIAATEEWILSRVDYVINGETRGNAVGSFTVMKMEVRFHG